MYRRAVLEPIQGSYPIESTEDVYTRFYVVTHGWTLKYLSLNLACGMSPDTPRAFFSQQVRWRYGIIFMFFQKDFWQTRMSFEFRLCYLISFLYYTTTAIQPFLSPIPAPFIFWTRPNLFKY